MKKKIRLHIILAASIGIMLTYGGRALALEYTWEDLCRIALERSEKIKIMEDNVLIAQTGKDKKMAALVPKLSAYGSYTEYTEKKYSPAGTIPNSAITLPGTLIQPNNAAAWGLRLDQSITLNGKEISDYSISSNNIERQQNEASAQKEEYIMGVSSAFYEVLRAQKVLEIANATVERLTAYRKAAERRLKVGEVTKTVLLRADGELSGALSDQIKAKNALDLSRAYLASIVGISGDFTVKEKFLQDLPLPPLDNYITVGLAQRAEMKAIEIEKQMTKDQVLVAKGGYWPVLSIAGVYGRMDQEPVPNTINRESVYGQVALNYPFFEGGLRRAEVKEAVIRNRQAGLKLDDLKKTIRIEVETTYLELKNQRGIIKSLEDQLIFAQDNFKAVTRQFEMGLANSIDVMDANTLLVSTERQLASAVYSHQIFQFRMKRATGILLKEVTRNIAAAKKPSVRVP